MHLNVIHSLVVAETKIDNGEDVDISKSVQDAAIQGFVSGALLGVVGYKAKCGSDLCKYTLIGVCTFGGTYTGGKAGIELSNGNNKLAGLYAVESVSAFFGAYKIGKSTPDIALFNKNTASYTNADLTSYCEYKALRLQGYKSSEAYNLMQKFRNGINPNNEFAFHFTTIEGGQGITNTGSIYGTKLGVAGGGVYAGKTPTPSWICKHFPLFGWGLGNRPVRIPIKISPDTNIQNPIIPFNSIIFKTDELLLGEIE